MIWAPVGGTLLELGVALGDTVFEGHRPALIDEDPALNDSGVTAAAVDLDDARGDVAEVIARHDITLDAARPDAVAKRRKTMQRTTRENIDDLCTDDAFVEYGQLVLTPGTRLPREAVIRKFSIDGTVTDIGCVNAELLTRDNGRCVAMGYDYTVLAGTQGAVNHPKTDRMLELAVKGRTPVVLFAEGGGGSAGTGGRRTGQHDQCGTGPRRRRLPSLAHAHFASMGACRDSCRLSASEVVWETARKRFFRSKPETSVKGSRSLSSRTMSARTSGVAVAVSAMIGGRRRSSMASPSRR